MAPRQHSDLRPEPNPVAPEHPANAIEPDLPWLLNEIIQQSPVGIAVIDVDGLYRNVNAAYSNLYGYAESELIGRSFTMVFSPENRQRALQRHKAFLSGSNETGGELEVVCRDGSTKTIMAAARCDWRMWSTSPSASSPNENSNWPGRLPSRCSMA
jgi:PAS domain S-box-containing protein